MGSTILPLNHFLIYEPVDCQIIMYAYVKQYFLFVCVDVLAVGDIRDCAPYCDHSSRCLIRR